MAKKSGKPSTRKKKKTVRKQPLHWFKKFLIFFLLIFSFVFIAYLGYIDYTVRKAFAGKPWSIPAKVYASPVDIYSGYKISLSQFERFLHQLNYRHDYQLASEGTYYKKGSQISLKTRHFDFWDKQQDSKLIRVDFAKKSIRRLISLGTATEIPIYRMDPVQIGSFYPTRKEDRILITFDKAPEALIQGLLATEDREFYSHIGISFKAIIRALWANIRAGSVVQGGSTITQQLIKNFFLTSERSLWRKINEAIMSMVLEFNYEKNEILEAYLNEIYLGQDGASSVHGFGMASEFYFGRPLQNLPLHEIATLVALVRGPSYYDPRRHSVRAIKRRNLVLDEMEQQGFISKKQAQTAKQHKLNVIAKPNRPANQYPGFLDLVKRQLREEYKEKDLTSEGLKIFTTLNTRVQDMLEATVKKQLAQLEKRPKSDKLETATIVTRREGGEIVALVGGRNPKSAGFNRALDAVRPIGSLIKPVVYLTALEYPEKYTVTTLVDDSKISIKDHKGRIWRPKNYDNQEHGVVELHTALAKSYNLATVRVGMDVGVARIAKTMKSLGVDRPIDLYPSLLLGASQLTPMDVTQMYQTLADDGFATPLRSIRAVFASNGERLQSYPYVTRQTVDPAATYITNVMMQEVMTEGTGRFSQQMMPQEFGLVGKTGTTNELRDSWFAGFSGDFLAVTWIGRDDNKSSGLTGSSGALKIWASLMKLISTEPVTLIPPDNVELKWIDQKNGLLANEHCEMALSFPYVVGSGPTEQSTCVDTPINRTKTWFNNFFRENF